MYSVIFKLLSLKCDFLCRILHFWPEFVLIPTGNTQGAFHVNATPKVLKYNFFYAKKFEVSRQLIINLKCIPKKQDDIKSKKCRYDVKENN